MMGLRMHERFVVFIRSDMHWYCLSNALPETQLYTQCIKYSLYLEINITVQV